MHAVPSASTGPPFVPSLGSPVRPLESGRRSTRGSSGEAAARPRSSSWMKLRTSQQRTSRGSRASSNAFTGDSPRAGTPESPWEVVDYKTGRRPPEEDPLAGLQLDLYALACTEVWRKRPEDLTLTYFYLATGEEVSRPAGDPEETRKRAISALGGIAAGAFDPTPSEQCHWCDFLSFCDAGKGYVEATTRSPSL